MITIALYLVGVVVLFYVIIGAGAFFLFTNAGRLILAFAFVAFTYIHPTPIL